MVNEELKFKFGDYEGPLDLLYLLIKDKKMDISEFSLIMVANQFVDYIENSKKLNLNESSEYLLIASQLLELKAKYLIALETGKLKEKEVTSESDLLARMLEYEKMKKASDKLFEIYENQPQLEKQMSEFEDFVINNVEKEYKLVSNGPIDIEKAIKRIYENLSKKVVTSSTLKVRRISIDVRRSQLEDLFRNNDEISFNELIDDDWSNYMIAITLLIILEMSNSEIVALRQENEYNDIYIKSLIVE